ncbi:MAG: DUF4292 domain-containing protein [Chitinophagales bacterium]|nr:DUF4292 domain-containing protein [Bacteroidota bacterium]MCB9042335.1 DUF4292 domain-containing protein [Chitinophagales bacterium]
MNKKIVLFVLLLGSLYYMSACKASREAKKNTTAEKETALIQARINEHLFDANSFSTKMKVKFAENGKSQIPVNVTLRMQRDSAIWISVAPALGISIEVARGLITPDSLWLIDKINKRYYAKDFAYIQNFIQYPLDFAQLQALLWGAYLPIDANFSRNKIADGTYVLENENATLFANAENFAISSFMVEEKAKNRFLQAQYSDYESIDNKNFATERHLIFTNQNKYDLYLTFSKIATNLSLEMPFKVSDGYTKMD